MHPFRFEHTWHVPAGPGRTFEVLSDVEEYPRWWPQVRRVVRIDADSGHAHVRSLLPYTLHLVLTRQVQDPDAGVLRVRIEGDLDGWSEFRLGVDVGGRDPAGADGSSTRADYRQEVVVSARGLEHVVPVAAPVLRLNHAWMMRSGERGLAALLRGDGGSGRMAG